MSVFNQHQINFRPLMRRPKKHFTRLNGPNCLLDHITFPRRAGFGVSEQIRLTPNAKQFMQQASIAEVNLRRFYLPLLQVGVPRWELTDHEDIRENVEITANSIFRKAQRTGGLGGIPDLAVVMCQHRPEAKECCCGSGNAPLRQISVQKRSDELTAPELALGLGLREKRKRESSSEPVLKVRIQSHLLE